MRLFSDVVDQQSLTVLVRLAGWLGRRIFQSCVNMFDFIWFEILVEGLQDFVLFIIESCLHKAFLLFPIFFLGFKSSCLQECIILFPAELNNSSVAQIIGTANYLVWLVLNSWSSSQAGEKIIIWLLQVSWAAIQSCTLTDAFVGDSTFAHVFLD